MRRISTTSRTRTHAQMSRWLQCRWHDEVSKNWNDEQGTDLATFGALCSVGEFLLMGYSAAFVFAAARSIRNATLRWLGDICAIWLKKMASGGGVVEPARVQNELWEWQKELRIW